MRKKLMVLATLVGLLVIAGLGVAEGAGEFRDISVAFRGISIMVNGNLVTSDTEPFIYADRTYLPVRAVAEALGAEVSFDANSNRVHIMTTPESRVYLKGVSAAYVPNNFASYMDVIQFTGIVVNATDHPLDELSISCAALTPDGRVAANAAGTFEDAVAPQTGVPFKFRENPAPGVDGSVKLTVECSATS